VLSLLVLGPVFGQEELEVAGGAGGAGG